MDYLEVMARLEEMGTGLNRKMHQRQGPGENHFRVTFSNLRSLKKQIKMNHELAMELWESGHTDAQTLSTMIADPVRMNLSDLDRWLKDMPCHGLIDVFVEELVCHSPHAVSKVEKWTKSRNEWTGRAGWQLLAQLAHKNNGLSDAFFDEYLEIIHKNIHTMKDRTKEAMNNALIAIGMRNHVLKNNALVVAADIGRIEIDDGQASCKTPDAVECIKKARGRRNGRRRMSRK